MGSSQLHLLPLPGNFQMPTFQRQAAGHKHGGPFRISHHVVSCGMPCIHNPPTINDNTQYEIHIDKHDHTILSARNTEIHNHYCTCNVRMFSTPNTDSINRPIWHQNLDSGTTRASLPQEAFETLWTYTQQHKFRAGSKCLWLCAYYLTLQGHGRERWLNIKIHTQAYMVNKQVKNTLYIYTLILLILT